MRLRTIMHKYKSGFRLLILSGLIVAGVTLVYIGSKSTHRVKLDEAIQSGDVARLVTLYEEWPNLVAGSEHGLALVAEAYLEQGNLRAYHKLMDQSLSQGSPWRPLLEARRLYAEGNQSAALMCLASPLPDAFEGQRCALLARFGALGDPETAWNKLQCFEAQEGRCTTLRVSRAHLLEELGQIRAARAEFVEATRLQPSNPVLLAELAGFYCRHGMYPQAINVWKRAHSTAGELNLYQRQFNFWTQVTHPVRSAEPQFEVLAEQGAESQCLRVLQLVQAGQEEQAYQLLSHSSTWEFAPGLQECFRAMLAYRLGEEGLNKGMLGQLEMTSRLAKSSEVWAALCLSAGWYEAALKLHQSSSLSSDLPSWVAYGLTEAYRLNRTPEVALAFAVRQPSSEPLALLTAELHLGMGDLGKGINYLEKLIGTEVDAKAHWLLSVVALSEGNMAQARQRINDCPKLADSIQGRELLARLACLEGNCEEADQRYAELRELSNEAKVYLSHRAYAAGHFDEARTLTHQLLHSFPEDETFRTDWKLIQSAQSQQ